MQMLKDEDSLVRRVAAESLPKLFTHENIPELIQMLRDEDSDVQRIATYAIISLGSEEDVPLLLDMIISGGEGASEAKDVLMGIDHKLYCPFEQSEDEEEE